MLLFSPKNQCFQHFFYVRNISNYSAIVNASKAAYLSTLIANGITEVKHFDPKNIEPLRNVNLEPPMPKNLKRLKKSSIEAFYYWNEISKLKHDLR